MKTDPATHLYILTAADGFTTACRAHMEDFAAEIDRASPAPPVRVVHWAKVNGSGPLCGWKKLDTWVWGADRGA